MLPNIKYFSHIGKPCATFTSSVMVILQPKLQPTNLSACNFIIRFEFYLIKISVKNLYLWKHYKFAMLL